MDVGKQRVREELMEVEVRFAKTMEVVGAYEGYSPYPEVLGRKATPV